MCVYIDKVYKLNLHGDGELFSNTADSYNALLLARKLFDENDVLFVIMEHTCKHAQH